MEQVKAWIETVVIPTYEAGTPEKNPIFLEKRVYQGSRGSVYPHPVIEKISQHKTDKEYQAVFLENEYVLIMILPSLGGRIQRAYDKIRKRDFVYYNQVIKPALVGLTGPWISGGIEFNWPQHHRPSTFDPIDFTIEENKDGSKTVWVNEVELMTRTKGAAGFTLYPGRAYLEIKGKLFNRTPLPQTFLWWANPAVKVNDHYQSIFPPDVHAVFDHGKRDVSSFPVATGTYYKVDYSPGTDISRYKNIPVPTSFMAVESKFNFIGGYEHDTKAGMLHVADHHISPGKKQWTWGSGNFGQAWDKNLTDEDGPYIELMCGVFTDNQPDFSWLQPNEEKTFEQYFMPYAGIGEVKNASKHAAINCVVHDEELEIKIYSTAVIGNATLRIIEEEKIILNKTIDLDPAKICEVRVPVYSLKARIAGFETVAYTVEVVSNDRVLVNYQYEERHPDYARPSRPIPVAAQAAPGPGKVETIEKLFLHGQHLEQYRHATYDPLSYYAEALRRDPEDIRCNNAMGAWYIRRGQARTAEPYLRRAVKCMQLRNPNPYDGEPLYNLGLCMKMQGSTGEAFDFFYKATWNDAWQHSGFLQLAKLACRQQDFEQALELIDKSLNRNYNSSTGRHLKIAILRRLGQVENAKAFAIESIRVDPFNLGAFFEHRLLDEQKNSISNPVRNSFNNYAEYALDYTDAGLWQEAYDLLKIYQPPAPEPMLFYYLGWICMRIWQPERAAEYFAKAEAAPADYCFPSKSEEVEILQAAGAGGGHAPKASYYLGNYWFANGNFQEAIACWERSAATDDRFPTVFRNLALAYYNKKQDIPRALAAMEKAYQLDRTDSRLLMELDLLHKLCGYAPWERLQLLESVPALVEQRNDLYMERLTLYNQLGDFETAKALVNERHFQPWEGGEGKIVLQFCTANIELAKQSLETGEPQAALELLNQLDIYPDNLGEGKLPGKPENDLFYWKGRAHEMMNNTAEAMAAYEQAKQGNITPVQAVFYNDPQPDNIFYQAKAWQKTGNEIYARSIFENMLAFAKEHLNDTIRIDYFAVSLPDLMVFDQDLDQKNHLHCLYIMGLGYLGLNEKDLANECFEKILEGDPNHMGAIVHNNCRLL